MLLFDTLVISVTLYHILGTWRLQKALKAMQKQSLKRLILQQGRLFPCAVTAGNIMAEINILLGIIQYMYAIYFKLHNFLC